MVACGWGRTSEPIRADLLEHVATPDPRRDPGSTSRPRIPSVGSGVVGVHGHSCTNAPSNIIVENRVGATPLTESSITTYSSALAITANGTTRL